MPARVDTSQTSGSTIASRYALAYKAAQSSIDVDGLGKWDAYTEAETAMFKATHTDETPWTVVHANDQKRARLEVMRVMLTAIEYEGKDAKAIGKADSKIAGSPGKILKAR